MSLLVDRKYIGQISLSLDKFVQKDSNTWNARCPFCGDSRKNNYKARLYIYEKRGSDHLIYYCQNCGETGPFSKLLKHINPVIYKDYLMDNFTGSIKKEVETRFVQSSKPVFNHDVKINLKTVEEMGSEHFSFKYLQNRKILKKFFSEFYYCDDFQEFVNEIMPDNKKDLPKNHKCIIIPFKDENKKLLGFQARSLYNTQIRYITIKLDEANPKIFGFDKVDFSKTVYVTEGPIDSTFIPNAVAAMDAALYNISHFLVTVKNVIYIFDNEPRNPEIVSNIEKAIDKGLKVCIWPSSIKEKDINDMVLAGENSSCINHVIDENTFFGLKATLELNKWRKS